MVVATRINHEYTKAKGVIRELQAENERLRALLENTRQQRKDFTVITVLDSHGNTWMGAAGDMDNDLIHISGVLDTNGVEVSERMLLVDMIPWCQNNGMTCRVSKREITTEI
jgi:hypothetical protein